MGQFLAIDEHVVGSPWLQHDRGVQAGTEASWDAVSAV